MIFPLPIRHHQRQLTQAGCSSMSFTFCPPVSPERWKRLFAQRVRALIIRSAESPICAFLPMSQACDTVVLVSQGESERQVTSVKQRQIEMALLSEIKKRERDSDKPRAAVDIIAQVEQRTGRGLPDVQTVLFQLMSTGKVRVGSGLTLQVSRT